MLGYSRYNYMVKIPDEDCWLVHNFRTGATLKLNEIKKIVFEHALENFDSKENCQQLKENGFLVDFDELAYLKSRIYTNCFDNEKLILAICPTLDCVFHCPYCFEEKRKGFMSAEVQKQTIAFIEKLLAKGTYKKLTVDWYGGEPSMYPKIINDLTVQLLEMCAKYHVSYNAGIVSNAYNLSQELIDLYEKLNITTLNITLDGPNAATHDETRYIAKGVGSFDTIISNLKNIKTNMKVFIRCNLQKNNIDAYEELHEMMQSLAKETGNNYVVYPARMMSEGIENADKDLAAELTLSKCDYFKKVGKYTKEVNSFAGFSRSYCDAQNPNDYVIDELGDLYKCVMEVGRTDHRIGNVMDFDEDREPNEERMRIAEYRNTIWPDDEECMNCILFPVCGGGCPSTRMKGNKYCLDYINNIDEFLLERYQNKK